MPDDQDYLELGRILATSESWTTADADSVRSLLASQCAAVAAVHPRDDQRRASMQAVVVQMETALSLYENR